MKADINGARLPAWLITNQPSPYSQEFSHAVADKLKSESKLYGAPL